MARVFKINILSLIQKQRRNTDLALNASYREVLPLPEALSILVRMCLNLRRKALAVCGAPLRKQRGMVPPRTVHVGGHMEVSLPSPGEVPTISGRMWARTFKALSQWDEGGSKKGLPNDNVGVAKRQNTSFKMSAPHTSWSPVAS